MYMWNPLLFIFWRYVKDCVRVAACQAITWNNPIPSLSHICIDPYKVVLLVAFYVAFFFALYNAAVYLCTQQIGSFFSHC